MAKKFHVNTVMALAFTAALFTTSNSLASAIYGFGSGPGSCSFWTMPFPISVQQPDDEPVDYFYNIIWVADDRVKGMDEYRDFYNTVYGQDAWPTGITAGTDAPHCTQDGQCVTQGTGVVGKGISAYDSLTQEFSGSKVRVASAHPDGTGVLTWINLPVRKFKVLRIEVFNPYTGRVPVHLGFVEPIYFEYRPTGNGSELQLVKWGSTANNTSNIVLPGKFNPVQTLDIQVWFQRTDSVAYQGITPKAHIDPLSAEQIKRIPASCL